MPKQYSTKGRTTAQMTNPGTPILSSEQIVNLDKEPVELTGYDLPNKGMWELLPNFTVDSEPVESLLIILAKKLLDKDYGSTETIMNKEREVKQIASRILEIYGTEKVKRD